MKKNLAIFVNYIILISTIIMLSFTLGKLICMSGNILSISIMNNAYNEVRDYAGFRLTHYIMEGVNPYRPDFFQTAKVPFLYSYNAINSIITAIICKITGISIIQGFYAENILTIILTVCILWLIIKDFTTEKNLLIILCIAINTATFFALFGVPVFNFRSDTTGIFISILMFLIVYKNRKLTWLLSLLTVLLLLSKQFMVLLACPLFIYYLIYREKRLAFRYLIECVLSGTLAAFIIHWKFPLYWTETVFVQFLYNKSYGSFASAVENIWHFYYRYFMNIVLILAGLILWLLYEQRKKYSFRSAFGELFRNNGFSVYLTLNLITGTLALLYLAKCDGDGYKYCQDLLAPSLFLLSVYIWSGLFGQNYAASGKDRRTRGLFILIILSLAGVINFSHFETNYYTKDDVKALMDLEQDINTFRNGKIHLSINSAQYLLSHDLWEEENIDFNDGHFDDIQGVHNESQILNDIFDIDIIYKAMQDYRKTVNLSVANKEYSLITTSIENIMDLDLLKKNYYPYKTYGIKTEANGMVYDVTLWLPR